MSDNDRIEFKVSRDINIKKEVSNKVLIPLINAVKEKGFELKDFLDGVPYDEFYFANKRERVEWEVFCKICTNMRRCFSPSDFEKIGSDFVKSGSDIEGLLAFLLFTSKKFSKLFGGKILKRITSNFLCLNMQIEFIGSNKIRLTLQMDDGYEHLPEFAYGNVGTITELGHQAGFKDCHVSLKFIQRGAVYDLTWKKSGFLFALKKELRWLLNLNKAFWELTDSQEELLKEYEQLEDYKNNLEVKVEERTSELKTAHERLSETIILLKKAQALQNHFFTNISHEFRTPLTMIIGPAKQLIEKTGEEKTRDELKVIHRNANRLLRLVNQLLDISKLESGCMKLETSPQNIISLLRSLHQSFTSYAERKRITQIFNSDKDEIIVFLDEEKFEKIITNILSNSYKFTPEGGSIGIKITTENNFINILISDTGIGIPKDKLPKIFDRFYQVDGSHTREQEGTGIGLSLTKELIELHKGKIEVESEEGKGTLVKIILPLGKEHLTPDEILNEENEKISETSDEIAYMDVNKYRENDWKIIDRSDKPTLLIIEDNNDVRNYIKTNLDEHYNILEAVDGEDGLKKSLDVIPDLIISDVMMPKLDGFKLCEKLKTDERTSHIPLILLTAKAAMSDKILGFKTGADDYMMKPFETQELKARIRNLIEQRKRIHEHFRKHGIFEISEKNITNVDQRFLERILEVITEHLSDNSFGVELLAEKMAVSRSLLLKKIEALLGEPPVELIKRVRLNSAAKLIEKKFGNISEIALEVGFNNPSYFAECFKKQFGCSPSQYHHNL